MGWDLLLRSGCVLVKNVALLALFSQRRRWDDPVRSFSRLDAGSGWSTTHFAAEPMKAQKMNRPVR